MKQPFTREESAELEELNRALFAAHGPAGTEQARRVALRRYLVAMTRIGRRLPMFEIANHRLFWSGDALIVPYDAHGTLAIHAVRADGDELLALRRFPHGTIVTDALIAGLTGRELRLIDLEREIYHIDVERMPEIRISRIRDMAHLLERLNACGSRHEAVYLLRFLVSRLCLASSQGLPGAKNIQPEVARLRRELAELLNGPFASRLRLPLRVLVRNVSGLVSRPKLIDELWQATIDLAEVHVRGSAITNEIRRSAHHGLGVRTLALARAYQTWLATGAAVFPGHERPAAADEAARAQAVPVEMVGRIVFVLEQILGSSQITERVAEWRTGYDEELLRCASGNTVEQDLELLIERGIRAGNRFTYQRYLRFLDQKCRHEAWSAAARDPLADLLADLGRTSPGESGFDPERVEQKLRGGVSAFVERLRADHQHELFRELEGASSAYERGEHLAAFEQSCELRGRLEAWLAEGAFPQQRYFLHLLDCLLEEMGYIALRHVASGYDETGLRLDECLRIVNRCAANLWNDGLFSRELWDLSLMLVDSRLGQRELLDVLEQIQRTYHRVVHRISAPYQELAERLGHDAGELRAMLANFQRTLHDLNSLVHLADRARTYVHEQGLPPPSKESGAPPPDPWRFVHLSHQGEIRALVESREGPSPPAHYGGKGAGLLYMSHLGVPTRDGFILPALLARMRLHETESARLESEVERHVRILEEDLEETNGQRVRLGHAAGPLLLAVRGGSALSMPGMLTTVVFVGMSDAVAEALAREDPWFAWDAYRRFLVSYAGAAWGLDLEELDLVEEAKDREGVRFKTELSGNAIKQIVQSSKDWIRRQGHGEELDLLLDDPRRQLHAAIRVVHASWTSARARRYREVKLLGDEWQTAVIVQHMAAGNRANEPVQPGMDETRISLTGVVPFTRVQTSGFREFTGDIKFSATGDDLVGGMTAVASFLPVQELRALAPMLERKLKHIDARLRRFRGTDPEIEFTVERGVLSVLQARSAQVETHDDPSCFSEPGPPAARGIGIRGGAFRGLVAFKQAEVESLAETCEGRDDLDGVLLVLENPTPDEIPLILSADGLLTVRGGSTSHAAVSVQGIEDRPYCAVMGVAALRVDPERRGATLVDDDGRPGHLVRAGDVLSIHGKSGEVFVGSRRLELAPAGISGEDRRETSPASAALRSSPGSLA